MNNKKIVNLVIGLITSLLISSCSPAQVMLDIDMMQTLAIPDNYPKIYETNKILGDNPDKFMTMQYFLAAKEMTKKLSPLGQVIVFIVEGKVILDNLKLYDKHNIKWYPAFVWTTNF